jgi:SAM-dependent methyltransferase
MHAAWNQAAAVYQERRTLSSDVVSYGALAPTEAQLALLGDLPGKYVLDLGCGGGHNAVACARAGATVTAVDFSPNQLAFARSLADTAGVDIHFLEADIAAIDPIATLALMDAGFDLILAVHVLSYVDDLASCLAACARLLRPGGRMIISLDHPIRACFFDPNEHELVGYPARNYFDDTPLAWSFSSDIPMYSYYRPLAQWFSSLHEAELRVVKLLELPAVPELLDELWPEDSPLAPLRLLPHTAILVAALP